MAASSRVGGTARHDQRLFPVVDEARRVIGVITRYGLRQWIAGTGASGQMLGDVIERRPVIAYADEPLRMIVYRMAETALTHLPVVERENGTFVGMLGLTDLLTARARILDAEQRRERLLGSSLRWPGRRPAA